MEQKMPKYWPGFKVLFIVLLLGLENGALGSIDPDNLHKIIKYITVYGNKKFQYAVAVRLDASICQDPTEDNLKTALPDSMMNEMHEAILETSGIYNPSLGNVVAARPNFNVEPPEHAEWRLLNGDDNSPTANILKNKENNCLIFFSKWSPCIGRCLNPRSDNYLVELLNNLFNPLENRAFVFESVYSRDADKDIKKIVNAWKRIKKAPLFRCDEQECIQCFDNNNWLNSKCLPPKPEVSKAKAKGGQSRNQDPGKSSNQDPIALP